MGETGSIGLMDAPPVPEYERPEQKEKLADFVDQLRLRVNAFNTSQGLDKSKFINFPSQFANSCKTIATTLSTAISGSEDRNAYINELSTLKDEITEFDQSYNHEDAEASRVAITAFQRSETMSKLGFLLDNISELLTRS